MSILWRFTLRLSVSTDARHCYSISRLWSLKYTRLAKFILVHLMVSHRTTKFKIVSLKITPSKKTIIADVMRKKHRSPGEKAQELQQRKPVDRSEARQRAGRVLWEGVCGRPRLNIRAFQESSNPRPAATRRVDKLQGIGREIISSRCPGCQKSSGISQASRARARKRR